MMKISGSLDITSLALVTLLINTGVVFTQISAVNQRTNSTVKGDFSTTGVLSSRQFGTPQEDEAFGVTVDSSGVYVAGITADALPDQTSLGGSDAFVRKYDHEGNELWTRQFGTPQEDLASGIGVDSSGVYVAGITAGALPDQTSLGGSDAFVIKLAKE
jgi:hypothetical protein